jgi:hypothetical protein
MTAPLIPIRKTEAADADRFRVIRIDFVLFKIQSP